MRLLEMLTDRFGMMQSGQAPSRQRRTGTVHQSLGECTVQRHPA
jgi:hypothetical protein